MEDLKKILNPEKLQKIILKDGTEMNVIDDPKPEEEKIEQPPQPKTVISQIPQISKTNYYSSTNYSRPRKQKINGEIVEEKENYRLYIVGEGESEPPCGCNCHCHYPNYNRSNENYDFKNFSQGNVNPHKCIYCEQKNKQSIPIKDCIINNPQPTTTTTSYLRNVRNNYQPKKAEYTYNGKSSGTFTKRLDEKSTFPERYIFTEESKPKGERTTTGVKSTFTTNENYNNYPLRNANIQPKSKCPVCNNKGRGSCGCGKDKNSQVFKTSNTTYERAPLNPDNYKYSEIHGTCGNKKAKRPHAKYT